MRVLRCVVFLVLVVSQALAAQIRVAETDYRAYRAVILDTGLEVLLVHDERAAKSAAALAVPVGSLDNPATQPGLAHYLEHMLFLGSAKYPQAGEFQAFLTKNGGQTNAATAYTSTVYMLEVDASAFAEAVRRMADTLAQPLLDPEYAAKELHAIDAEMESKKHSDGRRLAMLELATLHPEHPATRFTGGNLQTLADKPGSLLHEELRRFHRTWYSANVMKGVLYGPQSLDELEHVARRELTVIPDRQARVLPPEAPAVTPAEQGVVFGVRPVRESRSLSLEFVLSKAFDDPASKPLQLVAAVLGTETEHSLVEVLRDKGWVLGLSTGFDVVTLRNAVTLSLFLPLTEEGDRHRDEVLATVFAYFEMLRRQGVGRDAFDQMRDILAMEFRFAPLVSGFDYVAAAAEEMLRSPVSDVNFAPYRLDRFDQGAVDGILAALTPDKARIFHVGPDQPVDRTAFFYGTPYSMRTVNARDLEAWSRPDVAVGLEPPARNPFVSDDFSLVTQERPALPRNVARVPGLTVWHAPSRYRQEPKSILMARLQSAHLASTLQEVAMQGVLLELWGQEQAGLRYQAREAGLGVSVAGDEGLVVSIEGFSQHQTAMLFRVLDFLDRPLDPAKVEDAKAERLRALANAEKRDLFGQAMAVVGPMLRVPAWDHRDILAATRTVTPEGLRQYVRAARRDLRFSVFGFGNLTLEDMRAVANGLALRTGPEAGAPAWSARVLPASRVAADFRRESELEDSALVELFLDPEPGPRATARALLLDGLLSTRFYTRLRTEEQLGYVTTSFPILFAHCAGVGFGVQSPVAGPLRLAERFASFYHQALGQMRGVTEEEFVSVRQGLLASLRKTPDTLAEEFSWLETDLRLGNAGFDGRKRLAEALESMDLAEVVRAYETLVLGPGGTRLRVQVRGSRFAESGWAEDASAVRIGDPEALHALLGVQRYRGL